MRKMPYVYADRTLNCQKIVEEMIAKHGGGWACSGNKLTSRAYAEPVYGILHGRTKWDFVEWDWEIFLVDLKTSKPFTSTPAA